jgi:hypothetical protein
MHRGQAVDSIARLANFRVLQAANGDALSTTASLIVSASFHFHPLRLPSQMKDPPDLTPRDSE